jgi:thiol:disulfide interchange protein DsbD
MKKLSQLLAFVFLIYGASLFVGYLSGAKSVLHPFKNFTSVSNGTVNPVMHVEAKSGYSLARLQKEVEASSKPVMVDFRKKSCLSCDELEEFTLSDPAVQAELKRFKFIAIDITANTDEEQALLKHYGFFGTPSILFFDKDNNPLLDKNMAGFQTAEVFAKHLKTIP